MNWREEREHEVRKQALAHIDDCSALFDLFFIVFARIMIDDNLRKQKLNVSYNYCQKIICEMAHRHEI